MTDPELADWMSARMTPHRVGTYTQPVPHGDARSAAVERTFIDCTGNPPSTPDVFGPSAEKARAMGWTVHELAAGHAAMLTAPEELAALLLEIAAEVRRAGRGT